MEEPSVERRPIAASNVSLILELTSKIVVAFLSKHSTPSAELPSLIQAVHGALMLAGKAAAATQPVALVPFVPVRKSITPDYLVCLEDGKQMKMLRGHLRSTYGMTPDDYRARWNLPHDYPMVAANYAAKRSAIAKSFGLGVRAEGAGADTAKRGPGRPRKTVA